MKKAIFINSILAGSLLAGSALAGEVKDVVPEVIQADANAVVVQAVKTKTTKA